MTPRLRVLICVCVCCGIAVACAREPATDVERRARIAGMYEDYRKSFPNVPDISASDLQALMKTESVTILDVRTPQERAVSHIPGSILISDADIEALLVSKERVVTYCTIGARSGRAAQDLRKRGVPTFNLAGSILAWVDAGGPLIDQSGTATRRVHVYGGKWNLLPEGYEAIW